MSEKSLNKIESYHIVIENYDFDEIELLTYSVHIIQCFVC